MPTEPTVCFFQAYNRDDIKERKVYELIAMKKPGLHRLAGKPDSI